MNLINVLSRVDGKRLFFYHLTARVDGACAPACVR